MTSRIETVSRLGLQHRRSTPKTRCTTTPWRSASALSAGWCPASTSMAYMMHLPVAKWGRAFLERGLIEARFVKPVYDGETGRRHRRRKQRRACRSRSRAAASFAPPARRRCRQPRQSFSIADFVDSRGGARSASRSMRRPMSSANGSARCRAPGRRTRPENIWRIFARPIRSTRAKASAIPACCSG